MTLELRKRLQITSSSEGNDNRDVFNAFGYLHPNVFG